MVIVIVIRRSHHIIVTRLYISSYLGNYFRKNSGVPTETLERKRKNEETDGQRYREKDMHDLDPEMNSAMETKRKR